MYLSTMDDIRKEYELIVGRDQVTIRMNAKRYGKFYLPDDEGDIELWAKFQVMTVDRFWVIEKLTLREVEHDRVVESDYDSEEVRRQIVRYQLVDWNVGIPLEHDEEEKLTEACWRAVLRLPAPLVGAFVDHYIDSYMIKKQEEKVIDRQCATLFAKNSRGVENPCEAIALFCVLGNMWEKFGINRFQLKDLSYREYVMLRMVLNREIEKQKAQMAASRRQSRTRIAGRDGKTRPSRGVVVEE